jgi:hypothetical protein
MSIRLAVFDIAVLLLPISTLLLTPFAMPLNLMDMMEL